MAPRLRLFLRKPRSICLKRGNNRKIVNQTITGYPTPDTSRDKAANYEAIKHTIDNAVYTLDECCIIVCE